MANSTILSLMQTTLQAMGVVGYGLPSTAVGNTNQDVVQTLALVNVEGDAVAREHQWQALRVQYNFTANYYTYTGTVSTSSKIITAMSSTTGLTGNPTHWSVTGNGIPQDTFLTAASATTVTLNRTPTVAGTGVSLTFSETLFETPAAFDRPIDRTQWDKSKHWEMLGPITAQQAEWLRSGYISTGPRIRYWMQRDHFEIWPPLGADESLSYEYLSKYWIIAASATTGTKKLFTVDTDTCIFPDQMMRALIRLKYFEVKGFDTTAFLKAYNMQLDLAKAHDAGNATLSMNPKPGSILIGYENIPDSGFGS